jgi:5-methylcytosine-specific restriction enzyme A
MAQQGADREFGIGLKNHFECNAGAYSPVTRTEAKDGQVTLTGSEKRIVVDHFGADELSPYRGNDDVLEAAGLDARRPFRIFPYGAWVYPKLKYAKSTGGELRLYFNDDEFKVDVGHFWGVFVRDGDIWLCHFTPWFEQDILSGITLLEEQSVALEPETDDYQNAINNAAPAQVANTSMSWKRNPKFAAQAIERQNYQCEIMPELETFISKKTGKPFLEAHHLIPMKAQSVFKDKNLDTPENICILNPYSHRKLHHAPFELILPHLKQLIQPRTAFLESLEINENYVFEIYETG